MPAPRPLRTRASRARYKLRMSADRIITIAAAAIALGGLALLAWALLADRFRTRRLRRRGELRRCPRCWYDMSALPGLTCPECGRTARRERALARTRRPWRWAAVGLIALVASTGWILYSRGKGGTWRQWLPNTAVILLVPHTHESEWAAQELTRRLGAGAPAPRAGPGSGLYVWQWRVLAGGCGRTVERHGLPATRVTAILLCAAPPEASYEHFIALLDDEDQTVRYWGAFGLVNLRRLLTAAQLEGGRDAILRSAARESVRAMETRQIQARALQMELESR